MIDVFNTPIPGQSLTDEPKNYPWERAPDITDPRAAIKFHLDGLNKPETVDNIIELMQMGMPLNAIAKTALTTAQMEGIHSVDVSLIIKDVIYEELLTIAEESGVKYVTGKEPDDAAVKQKKDEQTLTLLRQKLAQIEPGSTEDDAGVELMRQAADMIEEPGMAEEPMMEEPVSEEPMSEEQEVTPTMDNAPRGLMARG